MECRTNRGRVVLAGILILFVLFGVSAITDQGAKQVHAMAPAPAATPDLLGTVQMTGKTINKTVPVEAIQEIDLRLGGGEYPGCMDAEEEPMLKYKPDNLELTDVAMISTCGWKPDETVKVTLMDPRGEFTSIEVKAVPSRNKKDAYEVAIYYQPGVDAPEGKYRFTFQGSGTVKAKVGFIRPIKPKLYALPDDPFHPHLSAVGGQQRLQLHGFLPYEPVRLLAYKFAGTLIKFYGWQEFTTNSSGQLVVETDLPEVSEDTEMNFYAYARETHFVPLERFTRDGVSKTRQFDMELFCPGARQPILSGMKKIQAAAGIKNLDIHQQPGFGSRVVSQIPGETEIKVYGYPKCIDRAYWWKVSLTNPPLFGWVSESFLSKYIVEPVK